MEILRLSHLTKKEQETWDTISRPPLIAAGRLIFKGNGVATKFNSGWLCNYKRLNVWVDGAVNRDFVVNNNDISFKKPPRDKVVIEVEIHAVK